MAGSDLLETTDPITIGGSKPGAIPKQVFEELLKRFPNTYELDRYADARVHTILSQHLDGMKDARARYESYLNKKSSATGGTRIDLDALKQLEVEKYILIRDLIKDALTTKPFPVLLRAALDAVLGYLKQPSSVRSLQRK